MPNEEMMGPAMPGQEPEETGALTPGGDDTPKKPKDKPVDEEKKSSLLEDMMFSPTAGDADPMIEIDKTTDDNVRDQEDKPQAEELLKILEKGEGQLSEKYQKELLDKALKDPTSVMVDTPRGLMTVRDAIADGFDLTTGDFTNEPLPKVDWEGELSKLDPREQETIRRLTQPGRRQAGPAPVEPTGDVVPGPTGEPIPEQATGGPANDEGALGEASMGGTDIPLGGV